MEPEIRLEPDEARVLGVLIEKELTTPDQYPLSLNALTAGCNQKSNRDPVRSMAEGEVSSAVERLRLQQLAGAVHPAGSRVERFVHNVEATLRLDPKGRAVMAELLLRGPQTPGDLRTRASRMAPIASLPDLAAVVGALTARGLVEELPPAPGSRARRHAQRLCPRPSAGVAAGPAAAEPGGGAAAPAAADDAPAAGSAAPEGTLAARVGALEAAVARLERRLATLADALGEPVADDAPQ